MALFFFTQHPAKLNKDGGPLSSKARGRHDAAREMQGRKEGGRQGGRDLLWFRQEGLWIGPGWMERELNDLYKRPTVRGSIRCKRQECPDRRQADRQYRQTDRQSGGRTRSQTARASAWLPIRNVYKTEL